MRVFLGIVVVALSMLCWGGQLIAWLAPGAAVKLSLMEAEEDVEASFWADIRGEVVWDALTLWTMVIAGVLVILDKPSWAYFGLVGGGIYVYFAGRGILTRLAMQRRGLRIGSPANVTVGLAFLTIWGLMGLITVVAALSALTPA